MKNTKDRCNMILMDYLSHISILLIFSIGTWLIVTPLVLLLAKNKNRLSIGIAILAFIPLVNLYTLFFLIVMKPLKDK